MSLAFSLPATICASWTLFVVRMAIHCGLCGVLRSFIHIPGFGLQKRGCSRACWRRHTLPHRLQCSTICARRLNDRVRYETGCTPAALATNKQTQPPSTYTLNNQRKKYTHTSTHKDKPASPHHTHTKPSTFSTGQLHASLRLHTPPIQLVVCQRSYLVLPMGNLVLRKASHLDAFSGYPLRRSLLSYATGVTTDTRALRPSRSSRTRNRPPQIPNAHSG